MEPNDRPSSVEHTEATVDPARPLTSTVLTSSRFMAIYEIGRQLLEQRDRARILETIHAAILEQLAPDHACLLAVGEGAALRPLLTHGLDLTGPQDRWPLSSP